MPENLKESASLGTSFARLLVALALAAGVAWGVWIFSGWLIRLLPIRFVGEHRFVRTVIAATLLMILATTLWVFLLRISRRTGNLGKRGVAKTPTKKAAKKAAASRKKHSGAPKRTVVLSSSPEIPKSVPLDSVDFSITAPATAPPGTTLELQFWVHHGSERETVLKRAQQIIGVTDYGDLLHRSEGPFQLERGAKLSVRIAIKGITITPKHKVVLWIGAIGSASFIATIPIMAEIGLHLGVASVRLNGAQIATLNFLFSVGHGAQHTSLVRTRGRVHKNAFASYAREDRDQVIARVQGMEAVLKGLRVFVDVVNLRSGQYWEQELRKVIPQADVFYLFWCRHAKSSLWVEREWRCALTQRGLDFIDPVPLESPEYATPPPELTAKHFNDPLLSFISTNPNHAPL